jgi:endonuclease YncB( thermonuclease family)
MRILVFLLALLATPALADVAGTASVIEGDTLEIHGRRIRLHGIDAPETAQVCRLDGKPWMCGKDAANALAEKISHRPVTCEDLGRDRYERMLARCTVAGEDLGEWLVANGWAVAYYQFSYEYSRAELRAKLARRGIWAGGFMQPEKWRRKHRKK